MARRGPIRSLRSDSSTNFIGAKNELDVAVNEMNHYKVHQALLKNKCDYFCFNMNTPRSSHTGGAWECMIR